MCPHQDFVSWIIKLMPIWNILEKVPFIGSKSVILLKNSRNRQLEMHQHFGENFKQLEWEKNQVTMLSKI